MKKLEPKKVEVINDPIPEPEPTPVKVLPKEKEKPDYTWVWILIGLLATMAVIYSMNISNPDKDGSNETK